MSNSIREEEGQIPGVSYNKKWALWSLTAVTPNVVEGNGEIVNHWDASGDGSGDGSDEDSRVRSLKGSSVWLCSSSLDQ